MEQKNPILEHFKFRRGACSVRLLSWLLRQLPLALTPRACRGTHFRAACSLSRDLIAVRSLRRRYSLVLLYVLRALWSAPQRCTTTTARARPSPR